MDLAQAIANQWRQAFPGWVILIGGRDNRNLRPSQSINSSGMVGARIIPTHRISSVCSGRHTAAYNTRDSSVPQADALLAQADGMSDLSARIPLYQRAEQLLVNQAAAIPLYQPLRNMRVRSHVVGWRIAPTGLTPLSSGNRRTSSASGEPSRRRLRKGMPSRRIS